MALMKKDFSFEESVYRYCRRRAGFATIVLPILIVAVVIIKYYETFGFGKPDNWAVPVALMQIALLFLFGWYLVYRSYRAYQKQFDYCQSTVVSVNMTARTITYSPDSQHQYTLSLDDIQNVSYYTHRFTGVLGDGSGRQISQDYMLIRTKDDRVIYLGFFFKLFEYLRSKQDQLHFPIHVVHASFIKTPDSFRPHLIHQVELDN